MKHTHAVHICVYTHAGFAGGSVVKSLPANAGKQETGLRSLDREGPREGAMAARSGTLA